RSAWIRGSNAGRREAANTPATSRVLTTPAARDANLLALPSSVGSTSVTSLEARASTRRTASRWMFDVMMWDSAIDTATTTAIRPATVPVTTRAGIDRRLATNRTTPTARAPAARTQ